jgi:hypothetical protein
MTACKRCGCTRPGCALNRVLNLAQWMYIHSGGK